LPITAKQNNKNKLYHYIHPITTNLLQAEYDQFIIIILQFQADNNTNIYFNFNAKKIDQPHCHVYDAVLQTNHLYQSANNIDCTK